MGDPDEDPANKKVMSIMYLSLGEAARTQFMDECPNTALGVKGAAINNIVYRLFPEIEIVPCIAIDSFQDYNNRAKHFPNFGTQ